MRMTMRQSIAYTSPCFDAEATTRPRFASYGRCGEWVVSLILTVNVGLE